MSDYPMLISNKLHSFRNFKTQIYHFLFAFEKYVFISKYPFQFRPYPA